MSCAVLTVLSSQSISYTDWLNSVVTSDSLGEVILAVLPQICYTPQYIKRTLERRFVSIRQRSVSFDYVAANTHGTCYSLNVAVITANVPVANEM